MSSYGNHCWTEERAEVAHRLISAVDEMHDDCVDEIMLAITTVGEMKAVAALAVEWMSGRLMDIAAGDDDPGIPGGVTCCES